MITIEELESIAADVEQVEHERRARLLRLIKAYVRIIAIGQPRTFRARATEYSDENGHWDNSFPPAQEYKNRTGPALIEIEARETHDIATTSGFYYDYKTVTTDPGLYIGQNGSLWGSDMHGTGSIGQFAAHPGDCGVQCEIDWDTLDQDNVSTERLQGAEQKLRELAFPLLAERERGRGK